ncbi:MAG: hypothetical protein GX750_02570 [Clostridia bacterium]|nr:hypothetical protein [Clostridia bacterium]
MVNDPGKVLRDFKEKKEEMRSGFQIMPAEFPKAPVKDDRKDGPEELLGKKKPKSGKILLFLILIILFCLIFFDD